MKPQFSVTRSDAARGAGRGVMGTSFCVLGSLGASDHIALRQHAAGSNHQI
jgi:hypothetical protein